MPPLTRFTEIDDVLAARIADEFGSPVYLLDEPGIHQRLSEMQNISRSIYERCHIAISYKTNPTRNLLLDLHQSGAMAEVVSGDEYQLALSLGVSTNEIIFNGPAKSDSDIRLALAGNSYLNCDHADELTRIETIARELNQVAKIGLRLFFLEEDNWGRFGFPADDRGMHSPAIQAIHQIQSSPHLKLGGLHAHIGTNIRRIERFRRFANTYCQFVEDVSAEYGIELEWIDAGGGLAGIAPLVSETQDEPFELPCLNEYCHAIIDPFLSYLNGCRHRPKFFLEPGRTLFNAFGAILVEVVGRRSAGPDDVGSVILNAGVTSLHFAFKYDLPVHVCSGEKPVGRYRLLGPTCMEQDVVTRPILLPELKPGDHLIIYGTGCYSMAMANSFINFRLGTVGWQDRHRFRWLRKPETIEHYKLLDEFSSESKSFE